MPDSGPHEHQNITAGIGLMVLAIFIFSVNDVLGKWLAASYSAPQIILFRSIAAAALLAPAIMRTGIRPIVSVARPHIHFARAALATTEIGAFYAAIAYLPLADAMTYYLAAPIYVTVIAALFLGEQVGWRRWTAVFVGFAGVLIALRPSEASLEWPALIALAGGFIYSVFLAVTRSIRGTSDTVMAAWQVGIALIVGIVGAPFAWTPLGHWSDAAMLFTLGVGALTAIICVNRSLRFAPASVVVPYTYMLIFWAVIFGYFVFDDVPGWHTIVGAVIIIAAGLFIFFREQKLARQTEPKLPPER